MGVIQRQGFKYSVISLVGMLLGIFSVLFIYPDALEVVGLFRVLFDAAALSTIFVLLGSPSSAVRFFARFRDEGSGHKGLLSFILIIYAGGFILYMIFFPFISGFLKEYLFSNANSRYAEFIIYIIPLTFCLGLINLIARFISNFRRIAIPVIFENLLIKITMPLIVIAYLQEWLTIRGVVICILLSFVISLAGMILYLVRLGQHRLTRPAIIKDKQLLQEFSRYSWYGILTGIGSQVAFRIDALMVSGKIDLNKGGLFSVALAITEVMAKPLRAIGAISGPMIAQFIDAGNLQEVEKIYKKSSLNLSILGLGIFLLIWTVLPYIFLIMPNTEEMQEGTYVILFLGLAQLWDLMTGVNAEIITYSKHYRFNLVMTLFLGALNIVLNIVLIDLYGITGAAIATCIAFFLFNLAKFLFVKWKFDMQPFSWQLLPVIALAVAAWLLTSWLPASGNAWIDLFYKGALFFILYSIPILWLRLSPDINDSFSQLVHRYGSKIIQRLRR